MKAPAPSSRELLQRMLDKVGEMRRALTDTAAATQAERDADMARAMTALDDLEARLGHMLEDKGSLIS